VNPTDPYVEKVGWRYLLRALEWAREMGLRVNLVLHAAPGSQNGWNHRQVSLSKPALTWVSAVGRERLGG
jgi:aryl-phospho-beta-D-glucosidase BglC (GH1 family)